MSVGGGEEHRLRTSSFFAPLLSPPHWGGIFRGVRGYEGTGVREYLKPRKEAEKHISHLQPRQRLTPAPPSPENRDHTPVPPK